MADDLDFGATIKGFSPGQKVLSRYKLVRILGRGGMGVVWLARDEELEREVALKFLPEVVALDKQSVFELKRETRRSLELTHQHIVRIYDFVQDGRTAAISMEYVAGDSLAGLKMDQPNHCYGPDQLAKWVKQLCEALHYAHQKAEVVHRDLKPANLMIDARGDLKVADFGIAASVSDSVSRVSAQTSNSGTPVYMSPQQMMGEKTAVTDDIYALGATLYDLITGKPPFHTGNIMMQVQNKVPPGLTERRNEFKIAGEEIPPAWEQTIVACLSKDAAERPGSARDVAHRLGLASAATAAPFSTHSAPTKPAPTVASQATRSSIAQPLKIAGSKSKIPLLTGLAIALLVLTGAGYYLGVQVPNQRHVATEKAVSEAAATRLEMQKKQQALIAERQERQKEMLANIDRLPVSAPRSQLEALEAEVKLYLVTAEPADSQVITDSALAKRRGWETYFAQHEPGDIFFQTTPTGAKVSLNGVTQTSPAHFSHVPPGPARLSIELAGYKSQQTIVEVLAGKAISPDPLVLARGLGSLRVDTQPSGIPFRLEGVAVALTGKTPARLRSVAAGEATLVYEVAEGVTETVPVTIVDGEEQKLSRDFNGSSLEFRANETAAEVLINGKERGVTPLVVDRLAPGSYAVEVRKRGFAAVTQTIRLAIDERKSIDASLALSPEMVFIRKLRETSWRFGSGGMGPGIYTLTFIDDESFTFNFRDWSSPNRESLAQISSVDGKNRTLEARANPPIGSTVTEFKLRLVGDDTLEIVVGGQTIMKMKRVASASISDNASKVVGVAATIKISVAGQVKNPGKFYLEKEGNVLAAIKAAGGFTRLADQRKIQLTRIAPDGSSVTSEIDLVSLANGPGAIPQVADGDIIYIPERLI